MSKDKPSENIYTVESTRTKFNSKLLFDYHVQDLCKEAMP